MIQNNKRYLITTDGWFVAPDGQQYRAIWGNAQIATTKDALGFNPVRSTNWFVQVGEDERSVIIAGCQIHYAVRCDKKPNILPGTHTEKETGREISKNYIYIPDDYSK